MFSYGIAGGQGGATFRSQGEAQVARLLGRYGIPYLYEHPVAVVDGGKTKIWYPDFQLAGYGVLIEYGGRTHDRDYMSGLLHKMRVYGENGLSVLMLPPESLRGNWPRDVLDRVEGLLVERLSTFRASRYSGG